MLKERISARDGVRVGVIGLGYVGLPLAVRLAERGFSVIGIDISKDLIKHLQAGRSTLERLNDRQIVNVLSGLRTFRPLLMDSDDPTVDDCALQALVGLDIFIVCVQTPLHVGRGWEPDTIWISRAAELIRRVHLAEVRCKHPLKERLVVLESTTYPGTTREIFAPLLRDLAAAEILFHLAYSPERSNPGAESDGNAGFDPFKITRIVGGLDEASQETAVALYKSVFDSVYIAGSLEAAEMMKLVENTFRFVSIGFANEMARIARMFGLNIWEIISGAKSKGFGLDLCFPGLIGGHCIPIDPHYLGWAVRNRRQLATFVDVAEKAHQDIRQESVDLVQRILIEHGKGLPGASVLFLGVAYKKNIADSRESGVFDVMKKLYALGAEVSFWDPVRREHCFGRRVRIAFSDDECRLLARDQLGKLVASKNSLDGALCWEPDELVGIWADLRGLCLSKFDCVIISTDHDIFQDTYCDLLLSEVGPALVDLRNAVGYWMDGKSSTQERSMLRERLKQRRKYMLLGVH